MAFSPGAVPRSLVFAALHGSVAMLLATFLVGFALTLLYERTRSLAPCVVAHGIGNLISVVLTVF